MMQRVLGIAGCGIGLLIALALSQVVGLCIIFLALGVVNGSRHDVWISFDLTGDGDGGDGGD